MRRAGFWWQLMMGIGVATFGLSFLVNNIFVHHNIVGFYFLSFYLIKGGFSTIANATQSLEVDETAITHQTYREINRVPWSEIKVYFLANDHFAALDQQHGKILLNVSLRGDNQTQWPAKERAQIKAFIERKMTEIGASEESLSSLRNQHGIKIKL